MVIGIDIRLIGKNRTGDEVVIFNLVKNLAKIGDRHEFRLFTDITDEKVLTGVADSLGIADKKNFEIIPLRTKNRFAWNFLTLPVYLRRNPVDVYHTQYITPFFVPRKIRITTIIHDISFNFFPQFIRLSDLFFLKILIPLSLRRADRIIAVSEFTKNEIIRYYKIRPKKVAWMHNAIGEDFSDDNVSAENLQRVAKKYGLPEKFILYVGTLQPRKNIPQLIEAFGRIKDRIGCTKLVVGGNKGADNYDVRIDEVTKAGALEGDIIFPGFIDEADKKAVFKLAHVFAFPSLYEGFGIPPLEAMSQGVPVICSDIPSLKEIAGEGAIYFGAGSLDDFAEKLYDICSEDDLRKGLILNGRKRIGFFSWPKSASKLLAIFEEMGHN